MSEIFWQTKIWGLLHDPALKALHTNSGRGGNSCWHKLAVMQAWVDQGLDPETVQRKALEQIHLADLIASASDRGALGSLSVSEDYAPAGDRTRGLKLFHLLSGASQDFKLSEGHHQAMLQTSRKQYLNDIEEGLFNVVITDQTDGVDKPIYQIEHPKQLFWWLWRCFPMAVCEALGDGKPDERLLLMPAETRLPDSSIWSHVSTTAALAGALTGFEVTVDDMQRWPTGKAPSRAYLASFSFTPIQELIKASRKMRDFWAGSWILHYLSARVCWGLANLYGPDSLVYPNLFQQPLIDHWLLEKWPSFAPWIPNPGERRLLTAGFPNVIVMVLPEAKVAAAMQRAEQILKEEWLALGQLSLEELQNRGWMPELTAEHTTWNGWLKAQWQTYWTAVPIGAPDQDLASSEIYQTETPDVWRDAQNAAYQLTDKQRLFTDKETTFLQAAGKLRQERYGKYPFKVNVGSWWPYVFDQARHSLTAVKNARTWELPTAFSVRSTISGIGGAVHAGEDRLPEGKVKRSWQHHAGLFDGREQLNATETVKRVLHKVLPKRFSGLTEATLETAYPDLTAGVAGYLKVSEQLGHRSAWTHFRNTCRAIREALDDQDARLELPDRWGLYWVDEINQNQLNRYHSRYLNPGWLVEEVTSDEIEQLERQIELGNGSEAAVKSTEEKLSTLKRRIKDRLQREIDHHYPGNNPIEWYVMAAGDGDNMNAWLKGSQLEPYQSYVPESLQQRVLEDQELGSLFQDFLSQGKRMGPATHSALSRALLDFSNQLVPYLTEQRYAGRLIYSGGDDVLAYTNLWEWDRWLWDVRECFRGANDPQQEFVRQGDYWQWSQDNSPEGVSMRPLFTMGSKATISFGVVIANQGVPLAIALENLWEAEKEAKLHIAALASAPKKDAVQVRVLYGNGNILKATAKFEVLHRWQDMLNLVDELGCNEPALFEQAAQLLKQYPIPIEDAIEPWVYAFGSRRDALAKEEDQKRFCQQLHRLLQTLWTLTNEQERDIEMINWLKLAAFVLRKRDIKIPTGGER
jgi:CRISPR-associated protein Cmr2